MRILKHIEHALSLLILAGLLAAGVVSLRGCAGPMDIRPPVARIER